MFLFSFLIYILSQKKLLFSLEFLRMPIVFCSFLFLFLFFPKLKMEKITINEFYFCLIYSENKIHFPLISLPLFLLLLFFLFYKNSF